LLLSDIAAFWPLAFRTIVLATSAVRLWLVKGYGANFYKSGDRYEGEWFEGKRSGWGRMLFSDGAQYEGEWLEDQRSGLG
jgi:hypothetical protein